MPPAPMFADSQMQNGSADAAAKRWRPPPKQGRDKVARRAAILLAAVALLFVGMKLGESRNGISGGISTTAAAASDIASSVTSSLHLSGGAQLTPDFIRKIEEVHADYERRHYVKFNPDFEMFLRDIKYAVDAHQLPMRVLLHIFPDGLNNVTLSPVVHPSCDNMWLEFGVHVGGTITHTGNWKLRNCPKDSGLVHGFDTFTGLPEDWGHGYQKGAFDLQGKLPPVPENVKLWKGLFSDSLPGFIKEMDAAHPNGRFMISYLHVDCDLYVGAKDVFTMLEDRILPGAIVVFDELCNYPAYRDHEVKAMWEWLQRTGRKLEVIGMMGPLQQLKRVDAMDLNPQHDLGGYQQSVGFVAL